MAVQPQRTMISGTICISHSPLIGSVEVESETRHRFFGAVGRAQQLVVDLDPDLVVIFHPDHINGFFYQLLPPFCVGVAGTSVGDFGTAPGKLNIPEDAARELADHLIASGIDAALSYNMQVDHGAVQPLEMLLPPGESKSVIPIFVNAAAAPRPTFQRVEALGRAVGTWALQQKRRILIIGSGGLSHDPPVPSLESASLAVRQRLIHGGELDHSQRYARQARVIEEGRKMAAGSSELLALNAEWDEMLLAAFSDGRIDVLHAASDSDITNLGGRGGHEVRTWVAALAAQSSAGPYLATKEFYAAIPEWIAGMGLLTATTRPTAVA